MSLMFMHVQDKASLRKEVWSRSRTLCWGLAPPQGSSAGGLPVVCLIREGCVEGVGADERGEF